MMIVTAAALIVLASSIAVECDEFAVTVAMLHFDKLFVRRLIRETKGS